MIIQSLVAKNFRKYKHLEIKDIPEKGLILVSGNNESGKTSIADALSFTLFGRTFLTNENNAAKLVCWGEKSTTVELRFLSKERPYLLTRTVSKEGNVAASFTDIDKDKVLAFNPVEVEKVLKKVLGYSYDTFSDSYYLVQRELSTPNANSNSVKDMIGIGAYVEVSQDLLELNQDDEQILADVRPQFDAANQQLKALGIDDDWLPELVTSREALEVDGEEREQLLQQLTSSATHYEANKATHQKAVKRSKWINLFADVMMASLFTGLLFWVVLKFFPEFTQQLLMPNAMGQFKLLLYWSEIWLPISVAVLAILFFIASLWNGRVMDKLVIPLDAEAKLYSDTLDKSYQQLKSKMADKVTPRSLVLLNKSIFVKNEIDHQALAKVGSITKQLSLYQASGIEAKYVANSLCQQMSGQQSVTDLHLGILGAEIDIEMERTSEAAGYRHQLTGFDAKIRECTRNIKVRTLSLELLFESAKEFTESFNRSITKVSRRILPLFTHNHYSNVKIDKNLNIMVFSQEKNDFMDFDEISSGTQRQIMLALRIAMSEELAKNNDTKEQFIILDEPFAFFDQQRSIETLRALTQVSDILTQVWVVSQEFPDEIKADKLVNCTTKSSLMV
ncbi:MAG: AAA family ATPase [Thiotrichaceae bacterium]|nr:AAA family ATPase [Thiotrichaceae bacterium]